MTLSTKMLQDFVDALIPKKEPAKESSHYGTIVEVDNEIEVLFDGAETPTPCVVLVDNVSDDDRVTITVRDNTAFITGVL